MPVAMADKLFLLDGMALVYRAHFAFIRNPVLTSGGVNTSALYGFTNTLLSILQNEDPHHIAVVFDTPEPTERHRLFPAYKAQREAMPEELAAALPHVKRMVSALGIPVIEQPGYEADDLIGSLARQAEAAGLETYMVTPDKDFSQLVTDRTFIYRPSREGNGFETLGVPEIREQWGVERTAQVIDILGLWGDASDNIPGIPGIGEKTAKKLVAAYGSLEGLLDNTDKLTGKQRENVEAHADQGRLSKRLATILVDAPVKLDLGALARSPLDEAAVRALLAEFEFNTLGRRLFGDGFEAGRDKGPARPAEPAGGRAEQGLLFARPHQTLPDIDHDYRIAADEAACRALAGELAGQPGFGLDTETTSLVAGEAELVGMSFAVRPGTAWFVPVPAEPAAREALLEIFRPVLADPAIAKTGHNLKYDLKVLKWHGVEVAGELFDTMLAHALIEPEQRHGMDFCAETCLGYSPIPIRRLIGEKKGEQLSMREVPLETLAEYAAEDADVTLRLREVLEPQLQTANRAPIFYDIESRLLPVLVDVEVAGVALDGNALTEISAELARTLETLAERIQTLAGTSFNLNSPRQLGEVLFDRLHLLENPAKTQTGQYRTDEQVLASLAGRHEIVQRILAYREATKLKSTYVDALPAAVLPTTGRIHTTFSQLATATGRLASSNPNLQNIPIRTEQGREIRKAFVPRDADHRLLSADYSQIELRIMASLSGDAAMRAAFAERLDIHAATAARVHGIPLAEVTADLRRQAKMINYGLMYGMSAFGLSQRLGISRTEAAEIVEHYFAQFPGIKAYIDRTIGFAREHGYVETLSQRRRYLREINSRNATVRNAAERNAVNTPIQGTGADMIKLAMIRIHRAFTERGLRSRMVLQVHDELLFEVAREELELVTDLVRDGMISALPLEVPVEVDIGSGTNWLEAH